MAKPVFDPETGADALLAALSSVGIKYLFANAGTDFPPIIESLSRLPHHLVPEPVTVPHETVAVGMAHGYYLVTGEPQSIMVHVNVGLANTVMGVINARADNIPMMVLSGRTPLTEEGRKGSRVTPIQYGQEMFDQTALVRESVKYDYELRYPEQADALVRRAYAVSRTAPAGPVYLSLPREPLAEALPSGFSPSPSLALAQPAVPQNSDIETLANWIDTSNNPLILCARGDPKGGLAQVVSDLAAKAGLAVCEPFTVRNLLPTHDISLLGYDPKELVKDADLILAVDTDVPWVAALSRPSDAARIVHIGADPLFQDRPVRSYRSDLTIASDPERALRSVLSESFDPRRVDDRRKRVGEKRTAWRAAIETTLNRGTGSGPMTAAYFSRCISDIMGENAVAFSELGLLPAFMELNGPNRVFSSPHSGGLGWGLPAALGAQLADRDRLVIAVVGDGSYMFSNPVACHQIAEALELPLLIVVKNNAMWNAVRRAVAKGYPDGAAMSRNEMPLTSLAPSPDFGMVARASRAHSERVERREDLPAALRRAVDVILLEKRHALVDVRVEATDDF